MKDGFDKSVAEKMPKIQKKRPNRPWNVDPVLIKGQEEGKARPLETEQGLEGEKVPEAGKETLSAQQNVEAKGRKEAARVEIENIPQSLKIRQAEPVGEGADVLTLKGPQNGDNGKLAKTVETIKDLNSDFTRIIFERKAIQQELDRSGRAIGEMERENAQLRERLLTFEKQAADNTLIEREIDFLNEQLEDADLYIKNMMGLLEKKEHAVEQETSLRQELESRFQKIGREIQDKAKLDVKVSILEKDLDISTTRLKELESKLQEEYKKREPLEQEIAELKNALERVYSSLAHIRLKAKREVYGS